MLSETARTDRIFGRSPDSGRRRERVRRRNNFGLGQEWERTVSAAEQEGQVVVYKIAHDSEWLAFQKDFPRSKSFLIQGNAAQIQQRLLAERRAGRFLADVVRLGGGTSTSLYKAKALDPIAPALILSGSQRCFEMARWQTSV